MTVYYGKTDSKGRILLSNERTLQELKEEGQELGIDLLDGDTLAIADKSIPATQLQGTSCAPGGDRNHTP